MVVVTGAEVTGLDDSASVVRGVSFQRGVQMYRIGRHEVILSAVTFGSPEILLCSGISLHTCVLRPERRGSVSRSNSNGAQVIDLGLLQAESVLERLLRGVKLARCTLQERPMARHGLTEIIPGAGEITDDGLRRYFRANARWVYQPTGTCAMGIGRDAVGDARLRVYGLRGLRVVDASIMPTIVSGNTNATARMIAERAADMILGDRRAG